MSSELSQSLMTVLHPFLPISSSPSVLLLPQTVMCVYIRQTQHSWVIACVALAHCLLNNPRLNA